MVILKNIFFNFLFFLKKKNIDIVIIIISFLIKFIIFLFFKRNIFLNFLKYFNFFVKKNINKFSRLFVCFFSIILFLNILIENMLDLLPNNLIENFFKKKIEIVPTSDINITLSLSIISFLLINFISVKNIGFKNFILNFLLNPIKKKYMFFFNFIIEFISFIMKPLSLSLRLFGNIFSSEIIFDLISKMKLFENCFLNNIWGMFHYLILPLQSFIFITLVIIYISQNLKH